MRNLNRVESRTCRQCGASFAFNATPSALALPGRGTFCSGGCQRKGRKQRQLLDSFSKRVAPKPSSSGCLIWVGSTDAKGYGRLGKKLAHGAAYELNIGPIPEDQHVLHRCDNPPCVNHKHLFLGTNTDNIEDKISKNRQAKGTSNGMSKLTGADINEIRILHKKGLSQSTIAKTYNVDQSTISLIINRKRWTHI